MNKKILYITASLFIILVSAVTILFVTQNNEKDKTISDAGIIKYELQTTEYFDETSDTNKYYINTANELDKFYSLYSNTINIDRDKLEDNSVFIQIEPVGSSNIKMELSSVTFDNNTVNFNIKETRPETDTMDMALWYLIAIIPNEKLSDLDLDEWKKPSEVQP